MAGFADDMMKKIKQRTNEIAADHVKKTNAGLGRVSATQKGRPLPEIKRAILNVRHVPEPTLTEMAEAVQGGQSIEVVMKRKPF